MRVQPDATQAAEERDAAGRILSAVLDRVAAQLLDESVPRPDIPSETLGYPGLFAAAYEAQAACRAGQLPPEERRRLASRLQNAVQRASDSDVRATGSDCRAWPVDLAPPEKHLAESLARAVAQVPQRPDRREALAALRVVGWSQADRAVFCETACLLAEAWPAMLAELRTVVRQVVLLDGFGVDGFTDVATHGAIYVNAARLGLDDAGLPGPVRLAEAVVHEGAHNRCNAAALSDPFLEDPKSGSEPVMMTPLRQDPRPLTGLLQQLVVLVRSLLLYDRLLGGSNLSAAAVARREKLRGQAGEALRVIGAHVGRLTDHGRSVVAEAEELLARSAVLREPATT
ncbi:MAG: hypothetical protein QOK16_1394 [Solirubrobacteraceae bacterium]|nr:hypothetical protein [Solirubrobacteraceae bacterium]